jgi:hypothetical protein
LITRRLSEHVSPINTRFSSSSVARSTHGAPTTSERAAVKYTNQQTAKLNELNPEAYLANTLNRIANEHRIGQIIED